jgi:hypothetical protein
MDELNLDEQPTADEPKKVRTLAIAILLVLAAVVALYYFLVVKKPAPADTTAEVAVETVTPTAEEVLSGTEGPPPLDFPAVPLDESDPAVREFASALSANPSFVKWLQSKELVRKFVAAVDNVANGVSPRPHIDFFSPAGEFKVERTIEGTFIDSASFARYDPAAEAFRSLDAEALVRLFRALKPLFQDAYRDLGYPGADFEETMVRAAVELLRAPVVDGPVRLEMKVLSYGMADENLENLSAAQKHFLRMGPRNVRMVQDKLRELAAVLGVPESRLPKARTYRPRSDAP